jgi:hypothetical protein
MWLATALAVYGSASAIFRHVNSHHSPVTTAKIKANARTTPVHEMNTFHGITASEGAIHPLAAT